MSDTTPIDYSFAQFPAGQPIAPDGAAGLAAALGAQTGMEVYPDSLCPQKNTLYFMGKRNGERLVGCLAVPHANPHMEGASRDVSLASGDKARLVTGATSPFNARRLRAHLPFLTPVPCARAKSAGTGDRLGLATPGHIYAFRQICTGAQCRDSESPIFPILAQQSIRENVRTGRTPQEVIDDAMWGVLQTGWTGGYGADADHLKTPADVDVCHEAGYSFFTVDPGDYVDDEANTAPMAVVEAKIQALDWDALDSSPADLVSRLAGQTLDLGTFAYTFSQEDVLRSAAKYGPAVAHTVRMARHLAVRRGDTPYDLEMSVDETATITSLPEHIYIGNELERLGITCVSLAPRYAGMFEKGVDYIGDLDAFARSFAEHVAVSRRFGPYKLSLHSGSDKFSIYPIAAELAADLIHLKTAGTSYLEAVRAIGYRDPDLFRRIMDFAVSRYDVDRQAYHVSGQVALMQPYAQLPDAELPGMLEDFHARQILHVTFGSLLNDATLRPLFFAALRAGEDTYTEMLVRHFVRHLSPFA